MSLLLSEHYLYGNEVIDCNGKGKEDLHFTQLLLASSELLLASLHSWKSRSSRETLPATAIVA